MQATAQQEYVGPAWVQRLCVDFPTFFFILFLKLQGKKKKTYIFSVHSDVNQRLPPHGKFEGKYYCSQ